MLEELARRYGRRAVGRSGRPPDHRVVRRPVSGRGASCGRAGWLPAVPLGEAGAVIDFTPYLPPSRGGRSQRWSSAAEAIAAIPEGARIFIGGGALVPTVVLQELADQRDRYTRLEIVTAGLTKRPAILEHPGRPFWFTTTHAT